MFEAQDRFYFAPLVTAKQFAEAYNDTEEEFVKGYKNDVVGVLFPMEEDSIDSRVDKRKLTVDGKVTVGMFIGHGFNTHELVKYADEDGTEFVNLLDFEKTCF